MGINAFERKKTSRTPTRSTFKLLMDGVARSFCVWPADLHLSTRSSNYNTSTVQRLSDLYSFLEDRGFSFSNVSKDAEDYCQKLLSFSPHERQSAAKFFSTIGIGGIFPLLMLMHDYDIPTRDLAFSYFNASAGRDLKPILFLLEHDEQKVRALALSAIRNLGQCAKAPLLKALEDEDHLIRSYALYAISEADQIDADLFKKGLSLVKDRIDYVRKRVADVVSAHGDLDLDSSRHAIDVLLSDDSRIVVIAAISAIKRFPDQEAKHFLSILKSLLSSPEKEIRNAVQDSLLIIEGSC